VPEPPAGGIKRKESPVSDGSQIDKSRKTVGIIAAIVAVLLVIKCGCNQVGLADPSRRSLAEAGADEVSLSPTILEPVRKAMERGAAYCRPFVVRRFRVTAYCPCAECCGRFADGITASGHAIGPGDLLCAADPSIPFGTMIMIPGYSAQPVRVLDRGGQIKGNRLDVLFYDGNLETSHARAAAWGVKIINCKLYIGN